MSMRRDVLMQWNPLDFEVQRGQARHDIAITTFEEVDAGDERSATSDGGGNDIGQSRAQIGDGDGSIGGCKRRGTGDDRAMLVVSVAEATRGATQAVRRHLRPGTQHGEILQVAETLLIDGLV